MAIKHVELDDTYTVKTQDENINVSVTIGEGQDGSYAIFLGTKFKSANNPANLGNRSMVAGIKTTISVVVVDELQQTNLTSMTVRYEEGGQEKTFGPFKAEAENHLDTVIYTLKISNL